MWHYKPKISKSFKRFLDPNCDLDDHQSEFIVLVVKKTHALQTLATQPSRETQIFRGDIRKGPRLDTLVLLKDEKHILISLFK